MPDRYYVCDKCTHFWSAPEWPDRCENCSASSLHLAQHETVEQAAEQSEVWKRPEWRSEWRLPRGRGGDR